MGYEQSKSVAPGQTVSLAMNGGRTTCTDRNPMVEEGSLVRPYGIGSSYWMANDAHTVVPWNGKCVDNGSAPTPAAPAARTAPVRK